MQLKCKNLPCLNTKGTILQGDKLLRLPSQSFDTHELLRGMSIMSDGPEEVMAADDYLRPMGVSPPLSPSLDMV